MTVDEAIKTRRSTRAFLPRPVDPGLLRGLLESARHAPSGGNLQPWRLYVLAGERRQELVDTVRARLIDDPELALGGEGAEYHIYPPHLQEPYRTRRFVCGMQLYDAIGIPRSDRAARLRQVARNYEFFGAPVGCIVTIERHMQQGQFVDLGLFLQSLALLAVEHGLATCMQESWANWPHTIRALLGVPQTELVFCGVSLGYPDPEHPINGFRTERAALDEFCRFFGM
jgi:nitroreductase